MNGHGTAHTKAYIKEPNPSPKQCKHAFYNEKEQLYRETDAMHVGLGASLLQVRDGMLFPRYEGPKNAAPWQIMFASKSLTHAETHYSNIERRALGIFQGLETFHYYCFAHETSMIRDH